ncbi:MAG: HAMP domain-containing protein [Verrucomicrobia bacterium]|nr:HAMP domain-containing protein [Verrucomicrobiota bacterium]
MRRGIRFRTKLILAMMVSTLGVAGLLIVFTGQRSTARETRRFSERFARQVDYLRSTRKERADIILRISREFAASKIVVAALRDGVAPPPGFPWKDLAERARNSPQRGYPGFEGGFGDFNAIRLLLAGPATLVALMDIDGTVRNLSPGMAPQRSSRRAAETDEEIRALVERIRNDTSQQIGYIAIDDSTGKPIAKEVAFTAVRDPKNGKILGALIMGLPAITTAEAMLEKFGEAEEGESVAESAILLNGTLYPAGPPPPYLKSLAAATTRQINTKMARTGKIPAEGQFTTRLEGETCSVHFSLLNPDSALPKAWQISTFRLGKLEEELETMHQSAVAVSLVALALSFLMALILSRSLSGPVRALTSAASAIGEGNFKARVPVRSRDELGELSESFNRMAEELAVKEHYRELLVKVSDEAVAQAMISGGLDLELGGELKEATILFCDIRGFTALTESMSPCEVIAILNEHMTAMTVVTREHHGVVDKFIGDAIMGVFGCLKSYGNDAAHAAGCALRMIAERDRLNRDSPFPLSIGIGLATGQVVAGCMGSNDRLNYTVLGSRVNLAARLASRAGNMEILIDETTLEHLDGSFTAEPLGPIDLRGFASTQPAFKLLPPGAVSGAVVVRS